MFYVSDDIYELGVVEIETPNGNKVRAYDKERCICDIIRSKGRMESEQVKKTIKQYMQSRDKDIAIRKAEFTEENLIKMVNEIINIDVGDNVKFKIEKTKPIRDEDEYGGLRITINFMLENIKDKFHIDLATGDPIYPRPDNYRYESLIGDEIYKVWSYNLETVLAEKIETILSKLETSSRMKDYYDIYLIYKLKFDKIDKEKFRGAVEKTFNTRKFDADLIANLNIVKESKVLKDKWISYSRKNSYARDVEFEDTLKCLEQFIGIIVPIAV